MYAWVSVKIGRMEADVDARGGGVCFCLGGLAVFIQDDVEDRLGRCLGPLLCMTARCASSCEMLRT